MATWRDGPEYAPKMRPDGFTEPENTVKLTPPTVTGTVTASPAQPPEFMAPKAAPPLTTLNPASKPARIATEPITALTTGLIHSANEQRSPLEPFAMKREVTDPGLAPIPTPTPQYLPTGWTNSTARHINPPTFDQPPWPPPATPKTPARLSAPSWLVIDLAVLAVGVLVSSLSLIAFGVSFGLLLRRNNPPKLILSVYLVGTLFLLAAAVSPLLIYSFSEWQEAWASANSTANLLCFALLAFNAVLSYAGGQDGAKR